MSKKLTFNKIMDSYYKGYENTEAGRQWKAERKSGKAEKMFREIGGKLSKVKALTKAKQ